MATNKLIHVYEAERLGFKVPKSYIFGEKDCLTHLDINNRHITKLIDSHFSFTKEGSIYHSYTNEFLPSDVCAEFFPSLIQERIIKKIEVRVFYIEGNIDAFAIFSQNRKRTELDYRRYDYNNPSKVVPYKLEKKDEEKIKLLHEKLDISTGSSDFIIDEQNDLYFLEMNPFGQFGLLSKKCNTHIEIKIAQQLIKYERKN